jgi:hypothetical protein
MNTQPTPGEDKQIMRYLNTTGTDETKSKRI